LSPTPHALTSALVLPREYALALRYVARYRRCRRDSAFLAWAAKRSAQ